MRKFDLQQIEAMREWRRIGAGYKIIAKMFGVTHMAVKYHVDPDHREKVRQTSRNAKRRNENVPASD